jgi:amino acid transporter
MGPGLLLLFIVGDILGTGIYALTGQVAKQVGGVVWLPFLVAFVVALITAFSYLELVTKYPKAAGAALYTHKAFGIHFVTFLVAFAVMCSGITSASTASRAFAANFSSGFGLGLESFGITLTGLLFMALVAIVNFRGVGESVKANVVLTCIELTGLLVIIVIGFWAIGAGQGDVSRALTFEPAGDRGVFWSVIAATTLAFFAMVGFEDSVNMAEECKDPSKIFPKVLLTGLLVTGLIYVLVSVSAITLVPAAELGEGETPLLKVVSAGAPGFPLGIFGIITMFAVANSALINMLMASRLVYGMSREGVLPPILGRVHRGRRTPYIAIAFTSVLAFGLITFVGAVRRSAARPRCYFLASSPSSTSRFLCCGRTQSTTNTSGPRRSCRSSARSAVPSSLALGPGAPPCNTRLRAFCWRSVSCSGFVTVLVMRSQGLTPSGDELPPISHSGPVN